MFQEIYAIQTRHLDELLLVVTCRVVVERHEKRKRLVLVVHRALLVGCGRQGACKNEFLELGVV